MQPTFKTIFDISQVKTDVFSDSIFRTGSTFFCIGLLLLLLTTNRTMRSFLQNMMNPRDFPVRIFLIIFTSFSLFFAVSSYYSYNNEMNILKESLVNGKGWITDGKIKNFSKVHYKKGDSSYDVSFEVNKIKFNYSDTLISSGYCDTNGPLREGLMVRIYYHHVQGSMIENTITKLEISE